MAIPRVYAPIKSGDFTLTPITVHKQFVVSGSTLDNSGSGYLFLKGIYRKKPSPLGSSLANNDPTNSIDGSHQAVVWKSIDHLYYRNPYNSYATFEHANRRYTYKFLNFSASIISIPYMDFGEGIKPGTFQLSSSAAHGSTVKFRDDGNGNIVDGETLADESGYVPSYNLIAWWGFNNEFRRFSQCEGTVEFGNVGYESRTFEPDDLSTIKNISFKRAWYNGYTKGMNANFTGESYIMTHDRPDFNPGKNEQFSISMLVRIPTSQSVTTTQYNTIVSKRGTIRKNVYGVNNTYNSSGVLYSTKHISSSIEDIFVDNYPYDIEFVNSTGGSDAKKVRLRRSDGVKLIEVTSSAGSWTANGTNHIAAVFDTGSTSLFINGVETKKTHSPLEEINNKHSIIFGSANRQGYQGLSGSLDEIRFYNTAITSTNITWLKNVSNYSSIFQTSVVGNIFYRQGLIVLSPLTGEYLEDIFTPGGEGERNWTIKFKNTHTVYQYETLCRIKKGSFNLTYNPTARKSFKSDLLINDMTGSLLMPYATTVGLYSDQGDLVAVGKLGQAVQMRDDVDISILVRWDA